MARRPGRMDADDDICHNIISHLSLFLASWLLIGALVDRFGHAAHRGAADEHQARVPSA